MFNVHYLSAVTIYSKKWLIYWSCLTCVTKITHCTVELTYRSAYLPFVSYCSPAVFIAANVCTCASSIFLFSRALPSPIPLFHVIFIAQHFLVPSQLHCPPHCCLCFPPARTLRSSHHLGRVWLMLYVCVFLHTCLL